MTLTAGVGFTAVEAEAQVCSAADDPPPMEVWRVIVFFVLAFKGKFIINF